MAYCRHSSCGHRVNVKADSMTLVTSPLSGVQHGATTDICPFCLVRGDWHLADAGTSPGHFTSGGAALRLPWLVSDRTESGELSLDMDLLGRSAAQY